MALTVETGAGLANADSYASVAEADARLSSFGFTAWAALDNTTKEVALRKATDYMVNTYRMLWKGSRAVATQALDWPRAVAEKPDYYGSYGGYPVYYDKAELPVEVKAACIDLALRASTSDLAADIERLQRKIKVGPIEVEYDPNAAVATIYRAVETKLRPLFIGSGVMTKLLRT